MRVGAPPTPDRSGGPGGGTSGDASVDASLDARIAARAFTHRKLVLFVLCAAMFMVVLDNTILAVAIPTITRTFRASASDIHWVIDAYTLVFAGLLIAGGNLADRFGRRRILRIGVVAFGAASVLSAFAGSAATLIGTRALMGIGAALFMPASLAIIATLFPAHERGFAIGVWAATAGVASVAGPIGGGLLLEHFYWGSVFLVNVPVVLIMLAATFVIIPRGKDADPPAVDIVGAVLTIAALCALLFGLIGASDVGWLSTRTLVSVGASAVLFVVLVRYLLRAPDPMIDPRAFKDPRLAGASFAMACLTFGGFSVLFGLAQLLQFVRGSSTLASGLLNSPAAWCMIIVAPLSGRVARRFGVRATVCTGLACTGFCLLMIAQLDASSSNLDVLWRAAFYGIGAGLATAPLAQTIVTSFRSAKAGVASGINDTSRQLGGALGIALTGSVTASIYASRLVIPRSARLDAHTTETVRHSVGAALDTAKQLGGDTGRVLRQAARTAFTQGFRWGLTAGAIMLMIGVIVAAVALPKRLDEAAEPVFEME